MRLSFLGTRGYIEARSRRHRRHSAALLEHAGRRVMLDCGADWHGRLARLSPDAIVLTHAHPDHAFGLRDGAPCPVHASSATRAALDDYPVDWGAGLEDRQVREIEGIVFEAFAVEHSTRCPAVGYRIRAGGGDPVFYVPDVAWIPERGAALGGCRLYVGDGATLERSMVRRSDGHLIGHAPVRQQLGWCEKEGVPRALFTHCGSEIVAGDGRKTAGRLRRLANARGRRARFAHDGMTLDLD